MPKLVAPKNKYIINFALYIKPIMNLIKSAFFILVCLIFACKNNGNVPYKSSTGSDDKLEFNIANASGTWASSKDPANAAFKLDDKFFYFNENGTYKEFPYEMHGDSLIVHYPNLSFGFKVILWKGDSIHLMDELQTNTFFRMK